METARLHIGPTVRFLGGVVTMLLASVVAAFVVGNALAMWNPAWGGKNLVALVGGIAAGPVFGLAGLACFAGVKKDKMLFLGGLTVFVLWYPLIYSYAQLGPYFGHGL
jgi:hypothetical protein